MVELKVSERQNYLPEVDLGGVDFDVEVKDNAGSKVIVSASYDNGSSTTTWTPAQITTKLWLKADAGITTNGVHVTNWQDQSGNGNDASQIGAVTSQPVLIPNWKNTQPAVYFDGNDILQINSIFGLTNGKKFTVAIVHQFDELSVARSSFIIGGRLSTGVNPDGSGKRSVNKLGVSFCTDGAATTAAEQWIVTGGILDSSVSHFYVGGIDTAIIASNAIVLTPTAPSYLGAISTGFVFPMFGSIAEIVVCDFNWSPTDRANWTAYVLQKYGV